MIPNSYVALLYWYVNVVESPRKWDPMPQGVACHAVALQPNTAEYDEVKSKFEKTMPSLQHKSSVHPSHSMAIIMPSQYSGHGQYNQIVKIERIQNPFLHAQYVAKKKTMDKHNPSNITNERELFHGCPEDVVEKISHHGFNRSFAGKNGMQLASYISYVANLYVHQLSLSLSMVVLNSRDQHEKMAAEFYMPQNTPYKKPYLRNAN